MKPNEPRDSDCAAKKRTRIGCGVMNAILPLAEIVEERGSFQLGGMALSVPYRAVMPPGCLNRFIAHYTLGCGALRLIHRGNSDRPR